MSMPPDIPWHFCDSAGDVAVGVEASVFDTQYDVQWLADGRIAGEPLRMPRTELFRKKAVVTKPMLKTWIAEVAACESVQVCTQTVPLHVAKPERDSTKKRRRGDADCPDGLHQHVWHSPCMHLLT